MQKIFIPLRNGLLCVLILLVGWTVARPVMGALGAAIAPIAQGDLSADPIYAYRDWQSVGIRVERDEHLVITASGSWLYTPGDFHGPEGHARFSAPPFYPAQGPGGSLIGRIGERGVPFYVGRKTYVVAQRSGMLYLRINDDVLSDNDGFVVVKVEVENAVE